jgi:hypothetical protein
MVSANNLKQYTKPDVSQMTLDIIEAIKTNQTVQFMYGGKDTIREMLPKEFFGDFDGFGGWTAPEGDGGEYRKFRLDKIDEWLGIEDTRHELECALIESRNITKEAKYLCYPIGEITTKLSSLADEHGLLDEMNELLDQVTAAEHNLESAFYECESVFEEAISDEELKSYVDQ